VKRVSTTTQVRKTLDGSVHGISRVTFIRSPSPANDASPRTRSILALVDDLATLAAELYVTGRLRSDEEHEG